MSAQLLEGKVIAEGIKARLKQDVADLTAKYGRPPKLVALQIGENQASSVYVKSQAKTADALGIAYELKVMPEGLAQRDAEKVVEGLNGDPAMDAVILQLPVPKQIDAKRLLNLIAPEKDAEGMHPSNLGKVLLGKWAVAPCTASACMALIESTGVNLYGKEAIVVGHSEIVGKPLSLMLLAKFATTTVCHIGTGERGVLPEHVARAEILVVAVGKAGLIKGDWVKEGAIVIDVGINKVGDKIVGDCEFDKASAKASHITPVPGGVGPLTVTMLMKNVVEACKMR